MANATLLRSNNVAESTEGFEVLPLPTPKVSLDDFMPAPATKPEPVVAPKVLTAAEILRKVSGCKVGHRPMQIDRVLVEASLAGEKLTVAEIAKAVTGLGYWPTCTEDHVLNHLNVWDPVVGVKAQRGIASRLKREGTRSYLDLSDLVK